MGLFQRVAILAASCSALLGPTVSTGAELRNTLCDRPVCRTVAISPDVITPDPLITGRPMSLTNGYEDCAGACQGDCGYACDACCLQMQDTWVGIDFLLGWRHSMRTPALVTTSPAGTAQAAAGVLPNATVIYPSEPFGEEARPGARISFGTWLDPAHCWGIEARYFMLADEVTNFSFDSTGNPILARPFFDVAGNAQAARLLAFPGITTPGSISIASESELLGGDALLRRALCHWGCGEFDLVAGYQFARLDESLFISDLSTDVDPANLIQDGTTLAITDAFATRNEYHAATIGAAMRLERAGFRWEVLGKIGLGNMRQTVAVAGQTTVTVPGQAAVVNDFGLLAQGANLGTFSQDKFSASPEISVKCVYQASPCIDVSVGYNFLYFTSVAQPGQQIDASLQVPTTQFAIRESDFWMHAFQCGLTMRF